MASTRVMSRTIHGVSSWKLGRDETLRLPLGRHPLVARVERGSVMLTQAGDPEDHVLGPGEAVQLAPRGLAVAWALTSAVLVLEEAGGSVVHHPLEAAA